MGFLDKAKKLAEQAQSKLDEVQSQINTQGAPPQQPSGPIVEYDKHGRPIPPQESASPPHGDPLAPTPPHPPAPPGGPTLDPNMPAASTAPSTAPMQTPAPTDPLAGSAPPSASPPWPPPAPGVPPTQPSSGPPAPVESSTPPPPAPGMPGGNEEDRNRTDYTPPKLTGGDPLAG